MARRWRKRAASSDKKDKKGSGSCMKDKQRRLISLMKSQHDLDLGNYKLSEVQS